MNLFDANQTQRVFYRGNEVERVFHAGQVVWEAETEVVDPPVEFSPLSVPELLGWYDGQDEASLVDGGGYPSSWQDLSGNVRHLSVGGAGAITMGAMSNGHRAADMANRATFYGLAPSPLPEKWCAMGVVEMRSGDGTQTILSHESTNILPVAHNGRGTAEVARANGVIYTPEIEIDGTAVFPTTRAEMFSALPKGVPFVFMFAGNPSVSELGIGSNNRSFSLNGFMGALAIFSAKPSEEDLASLLAFFTSRAS